MKDQLTRGGVVVLFGDLLLIAIHCHSELRTGPCDFEVARERHVGCCTMEVSN